MFAIASIVGAAVGLGQSPLPALVILSVLILAMSAAWIAGDLGDDIVTLALLQGVAGLIVVYGAVAFKMADGSPAFDGLWFVRLLSGEFGQSEILGIISGFLIAMFLWRRGIVLVVRGEAWETLHRTFRVGIAIISIALMVDISTEVDIGVGIIIFPFFVASLGGMAIGRVAEEGAWDAASAIWGRVILAVVSGVVAVGVVLGALGAAFGSGPLGLIVSLIVAIRDGIFWVLEIVLTPPLTLFFWFVQWFRDQFGGQVTEDGILAQERTEEEEILVEGGQAAEAVGESLIETIIGIIVWPVGIILLLIVLWILIKGFQTA